MADTTTQELLDAGELVGAARREAAFAERGGYTTTATLLARLAKEVEDGRDSLRELVDAARPVSNAHNALDDPEHGDGKCATCRDALRRRVARLDEVLASVDERPR